MADQNGLIVGADPQADGQPSGNPYIDALIWGGKWDFTNEPTITYFFHDASVDTQAFTAAEKVAFQQILANYEAVCNVTFTEVFAELDSDITWVKIPNDPDFVAYHDVPDGKYLPDPVYGIFTTSDGGWSNVSKQGSYFYNIVQHEIGHGMGLAHTHDGGDQLDATTFPGVTPSDSGADKGDNNLNQGIWSVMSYNAGWDQAPGVNTYSSGPSYGWAGTLMAFDIAALQYLYGVNNTYKTGDDGYILPTVNGNGTFWSCIWDAGGNDTISNAGKSAAAFINLNDAPLEGANAGGYVSRVTGIKGGFTIANGAMIENATGGDGNDYIVGNELDNVLIGGLGIDTVSYELATADVTVSLLIQDGTTKQDTGGAGEDTLSGFENLVGSGFDDTLIGDGNINNIQGGAGKDFIAGGAKNDVLDGGAGIDTADYSYLTIGNNLVVTLGALTVATGAVAQTSTSGVAGDIDTIKNFENVIGGQGDDKLTGNAGANVLSGEGGDDLLTGGLGSDILDGGLEGLLGDTASFTGITTAVSVTLTAGNGDAKYKNGLIDETDTLIDIENLTGGSGGDTLTGDDFDNVLNGGAGNDILNGGKANDTLIGGAGGDVISGGADVDTVSYAASTVGITIALDNFTLGVGGDAAGDKINTDVENAVGSGKDDKLIGNGNANKLEGGTGNDTIEGDLGDDEVLGGDGIDTASYATAGGSISVDLNKQGVQQDTLGAGKDTLTGIENLLGGSGTNIFIGNSAANKLDGGLGDDNIEGGDGNDILIGGLHVSGDTVAYEKASTGVVVSLAITAAQNTVGAGTDTLSGFENLLGSAFHDKLTGTSGANIIYGRAGDDVIAGDAGNDTLAGEAGDDLVIGGLGEDTLHGGTEIAAGDTVSFTGIVGAVTLNLEDIDVNNFAYATYKNGSVVEKDTVIDFENVIGGSGADILTGDEGNNRLEGGAGNDTLSGGESDDFLVGGAGADTIAGGDHTDTVSYTASTAGVTIKLDNFLTFGIGGDAAGDKLGSDIENVLGSSKDDKITGNGEINLLVGGIGNDTLDGGANNDDLEGGAGNDTLIGGAGKDDLIGGDGIDTASYATAGAGVTVSTEGDGFGSDAEGDTLTGVENIIGSDSNDNLYGDATYANTLTGGKGDDYLYDAVSGDGVDTLVGGEGNDTITGYAGDKLDGGVGTDDKLVALAVGSSVTVDLSKNLFTEGKATSTLVGFEHVTGSGAIDTLTGTAGVNKIEGMDGADTIEGLAGADILDGGGAHIMFGTARRDTVVYAQSDAAVTVNLKTSSVDGGHATGDTIKSFENVTGSRFDDILTGDDGNNFIEGGLGNDMLDGGDDEDGGWSDIISFASATAPITFSLALQGQEQKTGGAGNDTAINFEGIVGGKGNDILDGDNSGNSIDGSAGNDVIRGGFSSDILIGGLGIDTLSYANSVSVLGVNVDLMNQGTVDANGNINFDAKGMSNGDAGGDTAYGFENIVGTDHFDQLYGDNFANTIFGGDDGDYITGRGGNDILDGGAGIFNIVFYSYLTSNQHITVTLGAATASLGTAKTTTSGVAGDNDTIQNFYGVYGGAGNDVLTGNAITNELNGDAGNDRLFGLGDGDQLDGGGGNDYLDGGISNDQLKGSTGDDFLIGGVGSGTLGDWLDGGADNDTASYQTSALGVTVNLLADTAEGGDAIGDTLDNIENLIGSARADILTGDDTDNVIEGGLGDDTLDGKGGNDTISYASATAAVTFSLAAQGADQLTGGGGKDKASGFENILGGAGADKLTGDGDANTITGGAGNDTINGGGGIDIIIGGAGADIITDDGVTTDAVHISGTDALGDTYNLGAGNDTLEVKGGVAATLSIFNANNSDIENLIGNGLGIIGTSGTDVLDFSGLDSISNVAYFDGLAGNDTITGTLIADTILGGLGNDILKGGGDADTLNGGGGVDNIDGGSGNDIIQISGVDAQTDTISGGADTDTIEVLGLTAVTLASFNPSNSIEQWNGNNQAVLGTTGNDVLNFSSLTSVSGILFIDGGGGNDTITAYNSFLSDLRGGVGNDTLNGGNAEDRLTGGAGIDSVNGGDDSDTIVVSGTDAINDIMNGGSGNDTIEVTGATALTLAGFSATNLIEIWAGNNQAVLGTSAIDNFNFSALTSVSGMKSVDGAGGNDIIIGSYAADTFFGGAGDDQLNGGGDGDHLHGGAGLDTLTGGADADTFHIKWNEGVDTITDFVSGTDEIELDLTLGMANPLSIISNNAPTNAGPNAALLYDTDDGKLYYDSGPGVAVHIATLTGAPVLGLGDFAFL